MLYPTNKERKWKGYALSYEKRAKIERLCFILRKKRKNEIIMIYNKKKEKRNTNKQKIMERITRRRTEEKKIKEETITINMEQLEELWKDNEYAKEWKTSKYNRLLEENKWLKEQLEYWDKEYINLDEKVEEYR